LTTNELGVGPRFMHLVTDGGQEVERLTGKRRCPGW
jgi:hypothetical protein